MKLPTLAGTLSLLLIAAPVWGQEKSDSAKLPLQKVVMFSSGVAFFDRSGAVQGDASVELKFNVEDVNDLLKSMVLQDLGGGKVSTVTYGSKDPITRTLKTFSIDLTESPTLAELLAQVRGEKVRISAPGQVEGIILSVEYREKPVGDKGETVRVPYVNLLTEDGLRSISLQTVGAVKLLDDDLNQELQKALMILATSHSTDKKTVTLKFTGEGDRDVRVGYIQDAPIWKTSYRLVLQDEENPYLQGWAIVENTTEEDWKDVQLTLVSGRPISFIMDLYDPLYVPRPLVEPELFASLRPQTYNQDLKRLDQQFRQLAEKDAAASPANGYLAGVAKGEARKKAYDGRELQQSADRANDSKPAEGGNYRESVQSLAQASDVGELFQYHIQTPVTLARQKSAMLPIVNGDVKVEKVSIYNPSVQEKHPLAGLQLTNSTGLHLMQGPITVFDGGAYAGDAQIQSLPPGTERLISYALDLDTEVAIENRQNSSSMTRVRIIKGVLHIAREYRRSQDYILKNSGRKEETVLIEYPKQPGWNLVTPKDPKETTRDLYRFAVQAKPGEPAKLSVVEQMPSNEQIALTNLNDNQIVIYINSREVNENVQAALKEVIRRKQEISEVVARRNALQQQITVISQEQDRIRRNMEQLDRNTDLYNRYIKKFSDQEDNIEKLRTQISATQDEEARLRKALDQHLIGLNVE